MRNYPCFGKSRLTGLVVEFSAKGVGTVVDVGNSHDKYYVGYHSSQWNVVLFEPCGEPQVDVEWD